jgi:hypothetical protein
VEKFHHLETLLGELDAENIEYCLMGDLKNLESQRKIAKAIIHIMVYKSRNGFVPDYLSKMFVDRSSVTNYTLRDTSRKLALHQPRTNYLKNNFSFCGSVQFFRSS